MSWVCSHPVVVGISSLRLPSCLSLSIGPPDPQISGHSPPGPGSLRIPRSGQKKASPRVRGSPGFSWAAAILSASGIHRVPRLENYFDSVHFSVFPGNFPRILRIRDCSLTPKRQSATSTRRLGLIMIYMSGSNLSDWKNRNPLFIHTNNESATSAPFRGLIKDQKGGGPACPSRDRRRAGGNDLRETRR